MDDRAPAVLHRRGLDLFAGNRPAPPRVLSRMTDSIDRQALEGAGLDASDPAEWVTQWRISALLRWYGQQSAPVGCTTGG